MNTYHYTYLITNLNPITEEKYYIGVRTCHCEIENDTYMGSCSCLSNDITENGIGQYEKVIIQEFNERSVALAHEIQLHKEYNVGANPIFYNKAKQTSTGFDIQGNVHVGNKISETRLDPYWQATVGNEAFAKQRATKADPDWQATTGKDQAAKISQKRKGTQFGKDNPNFGNKMSAESKEIISKANKGRTAHNKGIPCSELKKANIAAGLKGKRWYNNGETRVYVFPEDKPVGYWPGLKLNKEEK